MKLQRKFEISWLNRPITNTSGKEVGTGWLTNRDKDYRDPPTSFIGRELIIPAVKTKTI